MVFTADRAEVKKTRQHKSDSDFRAEGLPVNSAVREGGGGYD